MHILGGSSFNIDKEIFTAGDHELEVTFISQDGQTFSTSLTFNIGIVIASAWIILTPMVEH